MFQNFHVVFYVTCRNVPKCNVPYVRYIMDRHVQINGTSRFLTLRYVT